jgi:glycosyltransferase involved in cell wall biosynthesis
MAPKGREQRQVRVLMIVENCPYLRDPRVRREANSLAAAGYKVSVIAPRGDGPARGRQVVDGVSVYRFRKLSSSSTIPGHLLEYLFAALSIAGMILYVWFRQGFDIIHLANPPDSLIFLALPYKLLGKSVIFDQHDLCPELYGVKFGDSNDLIAKVLRCLERLSYAYADQVIVTNESYKRLALERGGLPSSKVTIVRNGPDLESAKEEDKIDAQVREKAPCILAFAGIIEDQDGLDYLIRILHALRYKVGREDFCCLVMGSGHALEGAKKLALDLGLANHTWFTGWISDRQRYGSYLASSDICVSPEPSNAYNDRSTFVKIMEYMAAGKPIVAFHLCETLVSAEKSAVYARCNDEHDFALNIASLMDDPASRHVMGQSGLKRIREKLAWQYSVSGLLDVYQHLAGRYTSSQG